MKKTLIFLLLLNAAFFNIIQAQKISEGKLIYEISFPEMEMDAQSKGMMPSESIVYFKDNQLRMEIKMMGMSTVVISNSKDNSATTLMDMMGNKLAVKMTAAEIEKEKSKLNSSKFEARMTNETKEIAGFTCRKAIASQKDGGDIIIYCTNDIVAKNQGFADQYKGIEGFPMEYQMTQNGMNMKFVAKSVSKEKVDASKFTIPKDYKITTKEEIAKMFGGGK